jgi:hypothetical protein
MTNVAHVDATCVSDPLRAGREFDVFRPHRRRGYNRGWRGSAEGAQLADTPATPIQDHERPAARSTGSALRVRCTATRFHHPSLHDGPGDGSKSCGRPSNMTWVHPTKESADAYREPGRRDRPRRAEPRG